MKAKRLNMSNNKLSTSAAFQIMSGLNDKLEDVDFSNNTLGKSSIDSLIRLLNNDYGQGLRILKLENSKVTD